MPLPTTNLDDRRFQEIVDQAKRMIPQYCPEWTDHNVSDPGVTLIELFAWMTEMLLYRVNQVPEKLYISFLNMLGVQLEPPRAARVPVTFYLSAPQPVEVVLGADTEVATVRTENSPAIIFTTEADLVLRPPVVSGLYSRAAGRGGAWTAHDMRRLSVTGQPIALFPASLNPGDAFYIALERNHSHHVLALTVTCETAGGAGIDPTNPPLEWQVWQGAMEGRWAACEIEYDGTGGFNNDGEIILHLPHMVSDELQNITSHWLRCRLSDAQAGTNAYRVSPEIRSLAVETRGGTAVARHATTVRGELLGRSDGTPGQRFQIRNTPLLARDPTRDYLLITPPTGTAERWQEVADFAASSPGDRHYALDSRDGALTLGPALLQPDGMVYRFGAVPHKESELVFSRYQYGGGVIGNVPRAAISVIKTSIPYIARVSNRAAAVGGRDGQSIEDARLRVPQVLRTRHRAVTADDFEYLTTQVAQVARARCLAPADQPGRAGESQPGQVVVLVLPQIDHSDTMILPEELTLSAELRGAVQAYLSERCLIGTRLEVRTPQYIWVSVQAKLRVHPRLDQAQRLEAQRTAEAALYGYLNPYAGGPDGDGWPFGRDMHISEIYGLLQRVPQIEFVDEVQISVREPGRSGGAQPVIGRLDVPPQALVCSYQHAVEVVA